MPPHSDPRATAGGGQDGRPPPSASPSRTVVLTRGPIVARVHTAPLRVEVLRDGGPLLPDMRLWWASGTVHDRFVQLTEGVIPDERLDRARWLEAVEPVEAAGARATFRRGAGEELEVALTAQVEEERVVLDFAIEASRDGPLRCGWRWTGRSDERFIGLGARHGEGLDQAGRRVRLGADRRYIGPDCPEEFRALGGIPQGDCAPAPWVISDGGYAIWLETHGPGVELDLGAERTAGGPAVGVSARAAAGPLRLHVITDPTPAGRLRRYLRLTGRPALLPEWAYGHWKSRDVYEHQRDVEDDFDGYRRHRLPLDAVVIDSPWATHYNSWRFDPDQFPDAHGLIARMRRDGVRTVVWVTPWMNLESVDGQRPPGEGPERRAREPAPGYGEAAERGHFVRDRPGNPLVARWWMGTGSPVDFTSAAADEWWRGLARPVLEMGVEGIKADDGDGYYLPADARFADGRTGAEAAYRWGGLYRASMQRALDEAHPGRGVLFGRSGWTGEQRHGILWGGDQASDFWSLRALVAATLTAASSGFSNWSHDVGGYLGRRLVERCPKELLVRWLQFGCFTPLMHAHGRFEQEAWTYDAETLDLYRRYVLLHERLVPYIRAAAAGARRSGLPIVRPLCLTDPADPRGWEVFDAYGFGPSLWVAPVLDEGARERRVELPRGRWIDFWTGERVVGGGHVDAEAPLERIPVWVREGSLLVTLPAGHVAEGLGDAPEAGRPLEATLWGRPRLGRAMARLADGTRLGCAHGRWWVTPEREVSFTRRRVPERGAFSAVGDHRGG